MSNNREQQIIDFVREKGKCSYKEIFDGIDDSTLSVASRYVCKLRHLAEINNEPITNHTSNK